MPQLRSRELEDAQQRAADLRSRRSVFDSEGAQWAQFLGDLLGLTEPSVDPTDVMNPLSLVTKPAMGLVTGFLRGGRPDVLTRQLSTDRILTQLEKALVGHPQAEEALALARRKPRVLAHITDVNTLGDRLIGRKQGATGMYTPNPVVEKVGQLLADPATSRDLTRTLGEEMGHAAQNIGLGTRGGGMNTLYPQAAEGAVRTLGLPATPANLKEFGYPFNPFEISGHAIGERQAALTRGASRRQVRESLPAAPNVTDELQEMGLLRGELDPHRQPALPMENQWWSNGAPVGEAAQTTTRRQLSRRGDVLPARWSNGGPAPRIGSAIELPDELTEGGAESVGDLIQSSRRRQPTRALSRDDEFLGSGAPDNYLQDVLGERGYYHPDRQHNLDALDNKHLFNSTFEDIGLPPPPHPPVKRQPAAGPGGDLASVGSGAPDDYQRAVLRDVYTSLATNAGSGDLEDSLIQGLAQIMTGKGKVEGLTPDQVLAALNDLPNHPRMVRRLVPNAGSVDFPRK